MSFGEVLFSCKLIFSAFLTALKFFEKTAFLESEKSLVFGLNYTFAACVTCIFRPRITRTWSGALFLKFSVLPPGGLCFNPPNLRIPVFHTGPADRPPPWRYVQIGNPAGERHPAAPFRAERKPPGYTRQLPFSFYKNSIFDFRIIEIFFLLFFQKFIYHANRHIWIS